MLVRREDLPAWLDPVTYPARPFHEVLGKSILTSLGRLAEALRVFKDAFLDQVGDRVEVDGSGVAAEAQCFERDGAAASEAVEDLRRTIRVSLGE